MFIESITPRFSDTDALGHINNTIIPVWFEGARNPVFKLFMESFSLKEWPLILAKMDVEFHQQIYFEYDLQIKTYIGKIGRSSFTVYQEVWQQEKKCASGTAVMVHFSYKQQVSAHIPEHVIALLSEHLYSE